MKAVGIAMIVVGVALTLPLVAIFAVRTYHVLVRLLRRVRGLPDTPPGPAPLPPPPRSPVRERRPPEPPPPPSPLESWDGALRQALQRGFDAWWKGRRTCPGCDGPFTIHPPRDLKSLSTNTGYGFTYWTQELSCDACRWRTSFMHTDSGPAVHHSLSTDPARAPRRRWAVAGSPSQPAGWIVAVDGRVSVEPGPDTSGYARIRLSIAASMLERVASAVPPDGLADDEAARAFDGVVSSLLGMHGAPASRVDEDGKPLDSVKPEGDVADDPA